jgi:predicted ATPase
MRAMLKKIEIKNFKSLKDCSIELGDFNVVIGPNASGKTNFIELFKLLRKIYADGEPFPFLDWWGYDNVVWDKKEELPITVKLFFASNGYNYSFETIFTGVGGRFQILKEALEIEGILTLEREGEWMRVRHDEKFLEEAWEKIQRVDGGGFRKLLERRKEDLLEQSVRADKEKTPYCVFGGKGLFDGMFTHDYYKKLALVCIGYEERQAPQYPVQYMIVPSMGEGLEADTLLMYAEREIRDFIKNITILKGLDIRKMKEPYKQRREVRISEEGDNICNILYNQFLKENKIPDRVDSLLSYIFPDTSLRFELTQDGRILMKVFERYASGRFLEVTAPGISDGFYKALTIFTALESEPSLLVVDEVENSLHAKALELLIDELKMSECRTILTTHSPMVVDIVEPKDLILVDKGDEGTVFRRSEKPEEVRKELSERGITLSERWLYGKL